MNGRSSQIAVSGVLLTVSPLVSKSFLWVSSLDGIFVKLVLTIHILLDTKQNEMSGDDVRALCSVE